MMLTRTPYNAAKRAERNVSPHMLSMLPEGDDQFIANGYIRVFQDVRGKHGSEGDYVMNRPLRGTLNKTAGRPRHRRVGHHRLAGEERAASRTARSAWSARRTRASPC